MWFESLPLRHFGRKNPVNTGFFVRRIRQFLPNWTLSCPQIVHKLVVKVLSRLCSKVFTQCILCMLVTMGRSLWVPILIACAVSSAGRDLLLAPRATEEDLSPAPEQAETQPRPVQLAKPAEAPKVTADPNAGGENHKSVSAERPIEIDEGVIIKLVKLDAGIEVGERKDFSLSRIDKPLAHEKSADFQDAWRNFRAQNRLVDDGSGRKVFRRIQQPVILGCPDFEGPLVISGAGWPSVTLEQDLGDGRWLAQAKWTNHGLGDWCQRGDNMDKVIITLTEGQSRVVGDKRMLPGGMNLVHVGLVEARFDCKVPPADGERITIRRHAFLAQPSLPDDETTRTLFRQAVSEGKYPVQAVVCQFRYCKVCGGVGHMRRWVPGKRQSESESCTGGCRSGELWVPVPLTFTP